MPSVLDQPTCSPAIRAMCATIRDVVVLPFVPVTATTGTRGRSVVGPGPSSASRTASAAPETSFSTASGVAPSGLPSPSRTDATACPSSCARLRLRHG